MSVSGKRGPEARHSRDYSYCSAWRLTLVPSPRHKRRAAMADQLESRIRSILQSTPVEQLGTITAKDVRSRLLADGAVDEAWIKANKKAVTALISSVYEEACAPLVSVQPADIVDQDATLVPKEEEEYVNGNGEEYSEREGTVTTSQYAEDYEDDEHGPSSPSPARSKKKGSKSKRKLTDEEYARRLSSELNGRPRSSRLGKASSSSLRNKRAVSRTPKRNKKSAEHVDDSEGGDSDVEVGDAGYDSDSRRPAKKRKSRKTGAKGEGGGGGAKGGFKKEYILRSVSLSLLSHRIRKLTNSFPSLRNSVPLSALLEVERLSRPQVVKQLWEYIKGNDLQNPSNKREILCDDLLRPIFNADKIDMFKMNKVLGQCVPALFPCFLLHSLNC